MGKGLVLAGLLLVGGAFARPAAAQDATLEALLRQRQQARAAEVLTAMPERATAFGPVEVAGVERERPRPISRTLPARRYPLPALAAMNPIPERPPAPEPEPMTLGETIRWQRVAPGEEEAFLTRHGDALWTNVNPLAMTAIDTLATPEVRARLNRVFGAPTRTPVARSSPTMQGGSGAVQFEYWFAVNDTIPFVVIDRNGPFGRGVVLVGEEAHTPILAELKRDLTRLLMLSDQLMPYVDYYQHPDTGQWYRTGYDGSDYYLVETERPRWARRSRARGGWYEFR